MALDLGDAFDIEMMDTFIVVRRPETVDTKGRSAVTPAIAKDKRGKNPFGVVTAASPDDLNRMDDKDVQSRVISIVTQFQLQGAVVGAKPDWIVWRGDVYMVNAIDYYPQFGPGWVQALCGSVDLMDNSPMGKGAPGTTLDINFILNKAALL